MRALKFKHQQQQGYEHNRGGTTQQKAPVDAIHNCERYQREHQICHTDKNICGEGALIGAAVAVRDKQHRAVIKHGVDAGHLLQRGHNNRQHQRPSHAPQPSRSRHFLCDGLADLSQRLCAVCIAADRIQCGIGLRAAVLLEKPARTLGNEAQAHDEGHRRQSGRAEHPAPGNFACKRQRPVCAVGDQNAGNDSRLIECHNAAALFTRRNLSEEEQRATGQPMRYPAVWRDRPEAEAPAGQPFVVRLKAPTEGETVIADLVQGEVRVANDQLDDMVLLRADGTPTYMLSVVVDDHDMGITHVIRGDDHLTNAFRQYQLYGACGWTVPVFAHIPLIHGPDGAKLSKRHGALGVDAYRDMGLLPEAMRNYLLRLGWGHGDDEIISTGQAIEWFNLESVGRSASRFDMVKLTQLNGHYLRLADTPRLSGLVRPLLEARIGRSLTGPETARIEAGMTGLKDRAKTVVELADSALFYVRERPLALDDKAAKTMADAAARADLAEFAARVAAQPAWSRETLEEAARLFTEARGQKLGKIAQPLRAALAGSSVSPPIFEVMEVLGRDETLGRIADATAGVQPI